MSVPPSSAPPNAIASTSSAAATSTPQTTASPSNNRRPTAQAGAAAPAAGVSRRGHFHVGAPNAEIVQRRPSQRPRGESSVRSSYYAPADGTDGSIRSTAQGSSVTPRSNIKNALSSKPVWGIGAVFPKVEQTKPRRKRTATETRQHEEQRRRGDDENQQRRPRKSSHPLGDPRPGTLPLPSASRRLPRATGASILSAGTPQLERDDPFALLDKSTTAHDRPPSSRSHSDTVYEAPLDEADAAAGSLAPKALDEMHGEHDDSDAAHSSDSDESTHADEQGQVGGVLMESEQQWEDEFEPDGEGAPVRNWWGRYRYMLREPLAEWLGMLVLVIMGTGADCQVKISASLAGEYSSMSWCWGFGVMGGIYIAGGISGGHLNPSLTVALAMFRGFPWRFVPRYVLAQVFGAFCAALIVYGNYKASLQEYDPDKLIFSTPAGNASASLFITVPNESAGGAAQGFLQEVIATSLLTVIVLALGDENNAPPGAGLGALVLGFFVTAIGMSMGWISGYAINPARDFGPRLALWCLGYGTDLWTHNSWWWLTGPICGTLVGSILGAILYDACIFTGAGSPLNGTVDELAYALHLPRMHNMVRTHLYPHDSAERARARREMAIEAGLEKQEIDERRKNAHQDRPKDAEARTRWEAGRQKARHEDRKRKARRERKVRELLSARESVQGPERDVVHETDFAREGDVGEQRAGS